MRVLPVALVRPCRLGRLPVCLHVLPGLVVACACESVILDRALFGSVLVAY